MQGGCDMIDHLIFVRKAVKEEKKKKSSCIPSLNTQHASSSHSIPSYATPARCIARLPEVNKLLQTTKMGGFALRPGHV
jgi:hypothetical protein